MRICGTDNDQTVTRANCIVCANNFRTFRGFHCDSASSSAVSITGNNVIFEQGSACYCPTGILASGASCNNVTIRRCIIKWNASLGISFIHSAAVDNTNQLVENCEFDGTASGCVLITRIGGVTVRNSQFTGTFGVRCNASPNVGQVNTVNVNIFTGCSTAMAAILTTDLTEDYNDINSCATPRTNVSVGTHSVTYPPLLALPLLTLGVGGVVPTMLSGASQLGALAGTNVATNDLYGQTRATPSSWGAAQYQAGFFLAGVMRWRWERMT